MSWSLTPTPFKKEKIKHDVRTFVLDGMGGGIRTHSVSNVVNFKFTLFRQFQHAHLRSSRSESDWDWVITGHFAYL